MNVVVMNPKTSEVAPLGQSRPTLQDLEQAPDHSPLIRTYIHSIGPRLAKVIRMGRNAVVNGDEHLICEARHLYESIRGEYGRPEQIDEYFAHSPGKGALGTSPKQAAADIIHLIKDYLDPGTVGRYFRGYRKGSANQLMLDLPVGDQTAAEDYLRCCSDRDQAITDPKRLSRIISRYISYNWEDLEHPPDDYEGVYVPRPSPGVVPVGRSRAERRYWRWMFRYEYCPGVPWQFLRHPRRNYRGMCRPKLAVPPSIELLRSLMDDRSRKFFQLIVEALANYGTIEVPDDNGYGPRSWFYVEAGDYALGVFHADIYGIEVMPEAWFNEIGYNDAGSTYLAVTRTVTGFRDSDLGVSACWQSLTETSVRDFVSASQKFAQSTRKA